MTVASHRVGTGPMVASGAPMVASSASMVASGASSVDATAEPLPVIPCNAFSLCIQEITFEFAIHIWASFAFFAIHSPKFYWRNLIIDTFECHCMGGVGHDVQESLVTRSLRNKQQQ